MSNHSRVKNKNEKISDPAIGSLLQNQWATPWESVAEKLTVSTDIGLSSEEARKRIKEYGPNRLREAGKKSAFKVFTEQFKSFMVLLLAVATALSFAFGEWVEAIAIAIAVVIAINKLIGFFTEIRAIRSMETLRKLGSVSVKVRRNGEVREISAEELAPEIL